MRPQKWRVRRRWNGGWQAIDPRHMFLCGPGDRCLVAETWAEAFRHAARESHLTPEREVCS